jgi:hypothetical protein
LTAPATFSLLRFDVNVRASRRIAAPAGIGTTMICCGALRAMVPLLVIAATSVACCAPALAQKVDFSGQKITLAIATPPGGGYDLYGRLVGRY